MIEAACALDIG